MAARTQGKARSSLRPTKTACVELGARHPIVVDAALRRFLAKIDLIWHETVGDDVETVADETSSDGWNELRIPRHRVYCGAETAKARCEDRNKAAITVAEMRLSRQVAEQQRVTWGKQDRGRLKGRIANDLSRLVLPGHEGGFPDTVPVPMTTVVRAGKTPYADHGRHIALLPDQSDPAVEYFMSAHQVIMDSLGTVIPGFAYPYEDFMPKLTVGRIYRTVTTRGVSQCIEQAQELLAHEPLTVAVRPIELYP